MDLFASPQDEDEVPREAVFGCPKTLTHLLDAMAILCRLRHHAAPPFPPVYA